MISLHSERRLVVFRKLAAAVQAITGNIFIVMNKPGASATRGIHFVMQAKPDGYTRGRVWNGPLTMVPWMVRVTYKLTNSTPATLQGFLSGSVDIYTGASAVAIEGSMGSGAAKCLLVSSAQDNAAVPQASGLDAWGVANAATYIWYGIIAPSATPAAIVAKLESILQQAAATTSFKEYLQTVGMQATLLNARAMRKIIDEEYVINSLISKDLKMQQ